MRLLFLGLDGIGVDWFERLLLPSLPVPAPSVAWGELTAPVPMTGPSWTSIFTGKTVEEHGVSDLFGIKNENGRQFGNMVGQYLFGTVSGSAGVMAVPTTTPPRHRPGGWMVAGFPGKPATSPAGLLDGLDYIGDFSTLTRAYTDDKTAQWPNLWVDYWPWPVAVTICDLVERLHTTALKSLPAVDHLFYVSQYFDRIGHLLQHNRQRPGDVMAAFDQAAHYCRKQVWQLAEQFPADLVVLCSDHGWQRSAGGHDQHGFWAMWGAAVVPGRRDMINHQLRATVETALNASDPEVLERLQALGYLEEVQ